MFFLGALMSQRESGQMMEVGIVSWGIIQDLLSNKNNWLF